MTVISWLTYYTLQNPPAAEPIVPIEYRWRQTGVPRKTFHSPLTHGLQSVKIDPITRASAEETSFSISVARDWGNYRP